MFTPHALQLTLAPPACALTVSSTGASMAATVMFTPHARQLTLAPPDCAATVSSTGASMAATVLKPAQV